MLAELEQIATSPEFLWNGVACTPQGDLFASFPAWLGPSPGVMQVHRNGHLQPFPGNAWNDWARGKDPATCFVDVNSICLDGKGSLWVVDAAAPYLGSAIEGGVKLVELDLATRATKRVVVFDRKDAHSDTRLAHMRFHGDHAFLVESKEASIFVIDLRTNRYKRVLVGHPLLRCDPADIPVIEGRAMQLHGQPMYFHSDLIELGSRPDEILFMCLFGRKIFSVGAETLKDFSLSDFDIARQVTVAYELDKPFVSGIARDRQGNLLLADGETGNLYRMYVDGQQEHVAIGSQITWPIGPTVGTDGSIYLVDCQVNRIPVFTGGDDRVHRPWKMYKVESPGWAVA